MTPLNLILVVTLMVFALFNSLHARGGEVCFPFGADSPQPPEEVRTTQGHPGKTGPAGAQGQKGNRGPSGPPGQCACEPSEIEQLRRDMAKNRETIDRVAFFAEAVMRKDRVAACGVGLKDGRVLDDDITASSIYSSSYYPYEGRLDRLPRSGSNGAWLGCRSCRLPGEWIQVDLKTPIRIVAVVTQGMKYARPDYVECVTSYKISYGNSTDSMETIQHSNGTDLIFPGNEDQNTYVTNELPSPILARYVRLIVQTWINWGAIRLEYLSC